MSNYLERYFVNEHGSIECVGGGLLYPAESLEGLAPDARRHLAEIHSNDAEIDWEGAREILIRDGFMFRDADED